MRLRTRLALIVGLISLVGGILLSLWFAFGIRNDDIRRIDSVLSGGLAKVQQDPLKDASILLEFENDISVPFSVFIYLEELPRVEILQQSDGKFLIDLPDLSTPQLDRATTDVRVASNEIPVRYKALKIDDGQWVVVAVSTRLINDQFSSTFRRAILSSIVTAVLVSFLLSQLIGRELRPIEKITEDAQKIAAGNFDVALPEVKRHSEVGKLSNALSSMVGSLTSALHVREGTERRMREFLGDASHELRTPLTVIRGYVDILSSGREMSTGQTERALSRLASESKRMDTIINDLLLLAEMGEVRVDMDESVDLSSIVRAFARDLMEQQPGRRIQKDVADMVMVQGNSVLLERLIANIVSNIRQHTVPTVSVNFCLTTENQQAVLTVDDSGPGLSESLYQRTTEGFQRFDRHRSPEGGGFGLGLSIISSIVEAHHGTLEMKRSSLGGLCTRITLPTRHVSDRGTPA